MDLSDFRSALVWIKVEYAQEPDNNAPDDYEAPPNFTARVAYTPAALSDEDVEFLSQIETARLIDLKRIPDLPAVPPEENRAQRRARDRQARRADAVPPQVAQENSRAAYADYIVRLVKAWDVRLSGEPMPITREAIVANMEPGLRVAIVLAIMADYLDRPNRMISSKVFSGATTENGRTGQTPASEQNGQAGNLAGISRGTI